MTRARPELGLWLAPTPGGEAVRAARAEADGFDVLLFGDGQNLYPDPYVRMGIAAGATSRVRLATSVTNPVTRHPAVTAAAIASVQIESDGRAILGIGRGDSALSYIGVSAPAPIATLTAYVERVKAYLAGGSVDVEGYPSRLHWIPPRTVLPPVDVACTGSRTIRAAAAVADRLTFAVGAAPERVEWALAEARAGVAAAGRRPGDVAFGAYVVVALGDDEARARELVRGSVAVLSHFSALGRSGAEGPIEQVRTGLLEAFAAERREASSRNDSVHMRRLATCVDDAYVDWFAAVGGAAHVTARLRRLLSLGLDHLYLITATPGVANRGDASRSYDLLTAQVLPALAAVPSSEPEE